MVFRHAQLAGQLAEIPRMDLPRANPPRERTLSPVEESQLLEVCNQNDQDHLRFLLLTGLRRGELDRIKWGDLHGSVLVVAKSGRTGKARSIPLRPEARAILDRRAGLKRPFPTGLRWCRNRLPGLVRKIGLVGVSAHTTRHTFATRFLEATGDLVALNMVLGHSSMDMTRQYLHLTTRHLMAAFERAEGL